MKLDLSKLATLKDKVAKATNFSEPMNYFFDHFGENDEFMAMGDRVRDPFLEEVVNQVGQQLFKGKRAFAGLLLTRLPEHGFIHGGFTLNGQLGNLIYFEEIRLGLMAVVTLKTPGETKFMRFTGKPMPNSWLRSEN